jgi:hypothetical protein
MRGPKAFYSWQTVCLVETVFHSLSDEIGLLYISPEKCQLFVLVTEEMAILNIQHYFNAGCKAVMSLDD